MKRLGIVVALLAALVLNGFTLTTPAPASAESGIAHDPRGDRPAWMDLVKLRATNGQRKVRIALHVRDLRDRGKFEVGVLWRESQYVGYSFFVRVRPTDDGLRTVFKRSRWGGDVDPPWTCAENHGHFAWRPERDRMILTVPHGCLRAYDGVRPINNWAAYGLSYGGYVNGHLRFDSLETERLERG